MSLVPQRANFTFVAGAALVTAGMTLAFGVPAAGARPVAPPPGHGKPLAAVNGALTAWDHALADGDEVVFLPPVSGG